MQNKIEEIKQKIAQHNVMMGPCLTEKEIVKFEQKNSVCLPDEYRLFLKEIGNDAPGPFYGLNPLDSRYIDEVEINGSKTKAIRLCHEGCGYYQILVLEGPEAGFIWQDNRSADMGISKMYYGYEHYATPYQLLDWFLHWLNSGASSMCDMLRKL